MAFTVAQGAPDQPPDPAALLATIDDKLAKCVLAQGRIEERVASLAGQMGQLTGFMVGERVRQRGAALFGHRLVRPRVVIAAKLQLVRARDRSQTLSDREWQQVAAIGFVVRGWELNGHEVLYVVEASSVLGAHRVDRAHRRAAILASLGYDARPGVGGASILPEASSLAERLGVLVVVNADLDG